MPEKLSSLFCLHHVVIFHGTYFGRKLSYPSRFGVYSCLYFYEIYIRQVCGLSAAGNGITYTKKSRIMIVCVSPFIGRINPGICGGKVIAGFQPGTFQRIGIGSDP
jgi:hypothetical protein